VFSRRVLGGKREREKRERERETERERERQRQREVGAIENNHRRRQGMKGEVIKAAFLFSRHRCHYWINIFIAAVVVVHLSVRETVWHDSSRPNVRVGKRALFLSLQLTACQMSPAKAFVTREKERKKNSSSIHCCRC
jgi:hypothetical protein